MVTIVSKQKTISRPTCRL